MRNLQFDLQHEFEALVKTPDKPSVGESLKSVALAIWYDNFIPDVKSLKGIDAAQAGYVLDKLTRYNCIETTQKGLLRTQLLSELKQNKGSSVTQNNARDMLVQEWGARVELKKEFRGLMGYQRRSYKSNLRTLSASG